MKKLFYGLLIVLLCVITVGCGNNDDSTYEIVLEENGSTGYHWSEELSEEGIVELTSKDDYSECPKDVAGCSGKRIYTLKALKPGTVTLTLTYTFLDGNEKPSEIALYKITVDDDLKISETHSGTYFLNRNE